MHLHALKTGFEFELFNDKHNKAIPMDSNLVFNFHSTVITFIL